MSDTSYNHLSFYVEKLRHKPVTFGDDYWVRPDTFHLIENPRFEDKSRVHNWRNYVDENLKPIWSKLPIEFRAYVIYKASLEAHKEEWD